MNRYQTGKRSKWMGVIKGALIGLFSFLFILTSFIKVFATEKSDISLSVDYGFEHQAKYGRYIPVHVEINNKGKDFTGYVQTYASKAGSNVAYEKEVTVKKEESIELSIIIPVADNSGYLNVSLLNEEKEEVISRQYTLQLGNYDKLMYVGVLSDNPDTLDYLTSYGTKVFLLDESMIPEDRLGLDLLDVLIINQYDTKKLNQNQVTAIKGWVNAGGTLVFGTGEYQKEVLNSFSDPLGIHNANSSRDMTFSFGTDKKGLKELTGKVLDYEETKRIFIENIKSQNELLNSYGLKSINIVESPHKMWTKEELGKLNVEEITKTVETINVSNGITIKNEGGVNLLTVKDYGLGNIEVFHFDLGLSKEYKSTGLSVLTAIRSNISDTKKSLLDNEMYGAYMSSGLLNYIPHASVNAKPNILHYTLVVIIYILFSGPILYILLKKFDKRNWYFKMIGLSSLLFTVIIYQMGGNTRIDKPYMDYIKVSEFGENNTLTNKMYFSVTGNNNRGTEVSLSEDYNVKELSRSIPYIYDYRLLKNFDTATYTSSITYRDTTTDIKLMGLPAFSSVMFQLTKEETAENKLSSNLTNVGNGLNGSVTNHFNFRINNAVLISRGYIVGLGNITPGEEVNLADKFTIFLNVRETLYKEEVMDQLIQAKGMYDDAKANRVTGVLDYIMGEDINTLNDVSYLVGLKAGKPKDSEDGTLSEDIVNDFSKDYDVYGTEVVKLPVEVNFTKGLETFVPSMDIYLVANDSYYDKYYQARYLNTPEATITYHFPQNDKITRFSYLRSQNEEDISEYLSKFDGTIAFLNVKTGSYDPVFLSGYDESIYNVEDYLTAENVLTVRFSTDMSLKSFNIVLPHISYWKQGNSENKY